MMKDLDNKMVKEMISLKVLAEKMDAKSFNELAQNCQWEFTHDEVMKIDTGEIEEGEGDEGEGEEEEG